MTRNSLNLTELFENDNSRGSLLVELFQRRQGRIPKVNVFVTPQGNNCSFDIQLDRLSTVESTEQQRVPLYGHRNQNNPVIPSSTETIMNDNENDLEFVEQQSEALIAKPSNNHRRKLPCIKLPVCHGNGDTFKKMSLNDRVRRNNFRNSNSSRKSLMEDVNNLERTKRSIEFNPVICSTPYHKVLPSPKLRSQSNRKSNISNEHDVKQIADELENVLKTLAQDKTNHSQNDPTKAGISHAISDIGVAKEYESNISNGPNVHNVKQIVDELENALKTVTPDKTNHSQKRSSAKVTIRSAKKRVAREYDLEQASSTSSMKAHENQQQDIEDNGKGENEVEDGNDKIVENFEDKPKILSVEVIRSPFKNNSNKNTTSQDTLNEKKEKSAQDGQRNRNKKKQAFVMKPLENSQVPLDLGNANVNARKTRNSSNIEPLALQKLHKTDNTQTYEHHRKIRQLALNEAPGKPLNGEIYAKELTRSTYNKVLDLRKRTSVGKIFKVKNENEPPSWRTRQSKKKQLEQQELEQQINLKSLERDLLSDKSQQQLQQESQQQLQQLQQQSQRVTELELESQSQSMAIQEPPVEAQLEAHPEHAEHNMTILLDSDACYNECLASPKTLGNKTTETQRKRSIVKKTPNRKSNMKARNSKENMSSVLQNYMELPKRIE